jgi:hypothetical protein
MTGIYRVPIRIASERPIAMYPIMTWNAEAHQLIHRRVESTTLIDRLNVMHERSRHDTP